MTDQKLQKFMTSLFAIKVKRSMYCRTYDTTMVLPDGATIRVRYPEPRQIIR